MQQRDDEESGQRRVMKIFTVVDKPGSAKGIWLEIGVGSENRDGSISGKLDCLPVNGVIQVRPWEPRRKDGEEPRFDGSRPQQRNGFKEAPTRR